jgi:phage tail sheath protein FI
MVDGQKTLSTTPSKLDRLNARRGLIFMRTSLMPVVKGLSMFEPNDAATWRRLDRVVSPFCAQQVALRGLSDFTFKCDASTNSAQAIAAHQLVAKLAVKIVDSAEFIEVDVVIVNNTIDLKVTS